MSSIRRAVGGRVLAKVASGIAIVTVTMAMPAAPAQAADSSPSAPAAAPISVQSVTSCAEFVPFAKCTTNAIPANPSTHCVSAFIDGEGYGNIYDTAGMLGTHVGPWSFSGEVTVCGLYNWYYLEVRNFGLGTYGWLYS